MNCFYIYIKVKSGKSKNISLNQYFAKRNNYDEFFEIVIKDFPKFNKKLEEEKKDKQKCCPLYCQTQKLLDKLCLF